MELPLILYQLGSFAGILRGFRPLSEYIAVDQTTKRSNCQIRKLYISEKSRVDFQEVRGVLSIRCNFPGRGQG